MKRPIQAMMKQNAKGEDKLSAIQPYKLEPAQLVDLWLDGKGWKCTRHHMVKVVHCGEENLERAHAYHKLFAQMLGVKICKITRIPGRPPKVIVGMRISEINLDIMSASELYNQRAKADIKIEKIKIIRGKSPIEKSYILCFQLAQNACDKYKEVDFEDAVWLQLPRKKATLLQKRIQHTAQQRILIAKIHEFQDWVNKYHARKPAQVIDECDLMVNHFINSEAETRRTIANLTKRLSLNETSESSDAP